MRHFKPEDFKIGSFWKLFNGERVEILEFKKSLEYKLSYPLWVKNDSGLKFGLTENGKFVSQYNHDASKYDIVSLWTENTTQTDTSSLIKIKIPTRDSHKYSIEIDGKVFVYKNEWIEVSK